jgi:hypothetical protein
MKNSQVNEHSNSAAVNKSKKFFLNDKRKILLFSLFIAFVIVLFSLLSYQIYENNFMKKEKAKTTPLNSSQIKQAAVAFDQAEHKKLNGFLNTTPIEELSKLEAQIMGTPATNKQLLLNLYIEAAILAAALNNPVATEYAKDALTIYPAKVPQDQSVVKNKIIAISEGNYAAAN